MGVGRDTEGMLWSHGSVVNRQPTNFSYLRIIVRNFSFSSGPNANRRSTTREMTW